MLEKYHVILASNSPRRRELLAGLGIDFEVRTLPGIDESYPSELKKGDIPLYIAKEKADAYRSKIESNDLVITADTIVWLDGEVLGKPVDREEAISMLKKLSGRTHQVYTGVALTTKDWQRSFSVETHVRFAPLRGMDWIYWCRGLGRQLLQCHGITRTKALQGNRENRAISPLKKPNPE